MIHTFYGKDLDSFWFRCANDKCGIQIMLLYDDFCLDLGECVPLRKTCTKTSTNFDFKHSMTCPKCLTRFSWQLEKYIKSEREIIQEETTCLILNEFLEDLTTNLSPTRIIGRIADNDLLQNLDIQYDPRAPIFYSENNAPMEMFMKKQIKSLWKSYPEQKPTEQMKICFCIGASYDSICQENVVLAKFWIDHDNRPHWLSGKQNENVTVHKWIYLTDVLNLIEGNK